MVSLMKRHIRIPQYLSWFMDFKDNPHTVQVPNFCPLVMSRPSIVSPLSGVYDAAMEINEREAFGMNRYRLSLASQIKNSGYDTIYWYGGKCIVRQL